ncbi:hypothetical protein GCM10011400_48410 [Paraburkholderia caffeinilytica]|uniref:Uncharacterized protein n=1 Tax=Paraburkholderia caffeinilytica TaxID=1761016 RepID=A0ABQ1N6B4_9BURK|nr:hypothetical protein GCM10011400_48410 [Paraburkholderia caffeinilytica]
MALRDSMRGPVGSVESVGALAALDEAEAAAVPDVAGEFMVAVSLARRRLAGSRGICPSAAAKRVDIGADIDPGVGRRLSQGSDSPTPRLPLRRGPTHLKVSHKQPRARRPART